MVRPVEQCRSRPCTTVFVIYSIYCGGAAAGPTYSKFHSLQAMDGCIFFSGAAAGSNTCVALSLRMHQSGGLPTPTQGGLLALLFKPLLSTRLGSPRSDMANDDLVEPTGRYNAPSRSLSLGTFVSSILRPFCLLRGLRRELHGLWW